MGETTRLRGYRFGERRRSGIFGTVPPALAAVGAVALAAGWMAIAGYVPVPICIAVVAVCGWLWFGKLHERPAHEILPALAAWWWRRLRSRNRWYRPVALSRMANSRRRLPPAAVGARRVRGRHRLASGHRHRCARHHPRSAGRLGHRGAAGVRRRSVRPGRSVRARTCASTSGARRSPGLLASTRRSSGWRSTIGRHRSRSVTPCPGSSRHGLTKPSTLLVPAISSCCATRRPRRRPRRPRRGHRRPQPARRSPEASRLWQPGSERSPSRPASSPAA